MMSTEGGMFNSRPARALKTDLTVMLERTRDELPAIQELWPRFERLVGPTLIVGTFAWFVCRSSNGIRLRCCGIALKSNGDCTARDAR